MSPNDLDTILAALNDPGDEADLSDPVEDELAALKRQIVGNDATFVVHPRSPGNEGNPQGDPDAQVKELEQIFQNLNQQYDIARNPTLFALVMKINSVLSSNPELSTITTIMLSENIGKNSTKVDFERVLREIDRIIRTYADRKHFSKRINLHGKMVEMADLRMKILEILERHKPSPIEQKEGQIRYRIAVTADVAKPTPKPRQTVETLDSVAYDFLKKYVKELERFIVHIVTNPDETRLDHIGYDMVTHGLIIQAIEQAINKP